MRNAVELQKFKVELKDLLSLFNLTRTVKEVIETTKGDSFEVRLDHQAGDNFGSYAAGYRCFLKNKRNQKELYIYFGAIYSYKKQAGIFAEVDQNSNKELFNQVWQYIQMSEHYDLNKEEAPFVKLFLTPLQHKGIMEEPDADKQKELLRLFFNRVCEAFVNALSVEGGK
ncbi:hypothetical protein [Neobacillus bataviensis]|uniref:hypothetical protein n=1 Tax=Neobacillus bataviensis TaxID=220685 RepID=UPI001CC0A8F8|nr:hypothetical protein [Neobacillus bataviensis]